METNFKTIDSTVTGITVNFNNALTTIEDKIKTRSYVLKINGTEVSTSELAKIYLNLSSLTKTGRKKVAKRLHNYNKSGTLKSINYLFHVLKKMNVIEEKVVVGVSHKEAEIQAARKLYVKLRSETEAARIAYKLVKGDYYKS